MFTGTKRYWLLALLLTGGAIYIADIDRLRERFLELKASEEALEAVKAEVAELEATVAAARERLENYDSDPTNIEANVRQIKRRMHKDEKIFRVEFVPGMEDDASGTGAGLQSGPDEGGATYAPPAEDAIEQKDTGPN